VIKINNLLYAMIFIRLLSSMIELGAACLMYYFRSIDTAIRINAFLGMLGPIILILVTFIGLVGISSEINIKNLMLIATGVILILIGTR